MHTLVSSLVSCELNTTEESYCAACCCKHQNCDILYAVSKKKDIKSEKKVKKEKGRKKKKNEGAVHVVLVFGIGMELPAGGSPQAKLPVGIAAELRSLVKRKKPTGVLGFILHCLPQRCENYS